MPIPDTTERLVIDGVSLSTRAWWIDDLTPLMEEAEQRGTDRIIPGTPGVVAYPRLRTVTRKLLPMMVNGIYDHLGAAYSDPKVGLETNIAYLNTNVVAPPGTSDGTRSATWHLPDGSTTRTASVHVLSLTLGVKESAKWRSAVLELSIPAGRFT